MNMPNPEYRQREQSKTFAAGNRSSDRAGRRSRLPARGILAVEFALLLPLILLLTLAAADFGRVMHAYLVVSNAARCGAEYGSMHGFTSYTQSSWQSQVLSAMNAEMSGLQGFSAASFQASCSTATDSDGLYQISVTASYPFTTIVNWPGVPSQIQLTHQVVMRQIR
jgi:Flp pilus assembly protein TadG